MENTAQSELLNERVYKNLCHAYARPQVYVPLQGGRVYYFPQGHIEQLEDSIQQGLDQQLSKFHLPEKILCKVINVLLRDEPDTEEMYANITLLPEHNQTDMFAGVRRHTSPSNTMLGESVNLSHNQLMVLSVASHALTMRTRFSVIYKPRCRRSSFIINQNKYLEAQNRIIYVGMKFMVTFEDADFSESWFGGTVAAVGESEWKSIEVEWDEKSTLVRPDKVSFWEIEPLQRSIWNSCLRKFKKLFGCACF